VILAALAPMASLAAGIATVTDVVNEGYRQPPGASERRAAAADELVSDEALRTDRDSSIALTFIDGSELSVEQQSEVVLSDYVFDSSQAATSGVISLNAGLFHFTSNNAVRDDGLVLRTPVATIGIRGTQFLVTVADDATIVDILEGMVEVKPLGGGKPILCEGGQSILVASADSDAVCGDLGSFSTAAAPPTQRANAPGNISGRDRAQQASEGKSPGGKSGGGSSGGGSSGGGDSGGGDPGGGDPGGPQDGKDNHSGHGDGSNPGKGHGNGNGNHGAGNGGSNNPGAGNK
jgi:uncharacterized membrane protein YgcG